MVKIRLKRMGAKKRPFYRIVVADSRSPRDGRFIEELGYYDPLKNPAEIKIDEVRAVDWLKKGAQLTETARSLFNKVGLLSKSAGESQWELAQLFFYEAHIRHPPGPQDNCPLFRAVVAESAGLGGPIS